MTSSVRSFAHLGQQVDFDANAFGNKAFYLNLMMTRGLRVPAGIALSSEAAINPNSTIRDLVKATFFSDAVEALVDLAVRSSASSEDLASGSQAGHFLTELNAFSSPDDVLEAVRHVAAARRDASGEVGVIIQRQVIARYSGVAFSMDPVSFDRSRLTIAFVEGVGEQLVSGKSSSTTMQLARNPATPREKPNACPDDFWPLVPPLLEALVDLERHLGRPIDCEWAMDAHSTLWFLQVRPVVLPLASETVLESAAAFSSLPPVVRQHHKLALRQFCVEAGIPMSAAVVHVRTGVEPKVTDTATSQTDASAATSVVLLYPPTVDGQVIREFSAHRPKASDGAETDGTTIRTPKFFRVYDAIDHVLDIGLTRSWLAVAIDAQIMNADITGIISRCDGGFLVEMAYGHFVPKGEVPTQQFLVFDDRSVRRTRAPRQVEAVVFVNGYVVRRPLPNPVEADTVEIDSRHARAACAVLGPTIREGTFAALEFGIYDARVDSEESVYLIDTIESATMNVSAPSIADGIISPGTVTGTIAQVSLNDLSAGVDYHFHSQRGTVGGIRNQIFVADRDSIQLLVLVEKVEADCGFIFRNASVLSHLAIILRERQIPAVVSDRVSELVEGQRCTISAAGTLFFSN